MSNGNTSYQLRCELNNAKDYLTGLTNEKDGTYSFDLCVTVSYGATLRIRIETWPAPIGNGSPCAIYHSPPQGTRPLELITKFLLRNFEGQVQIQWIWANDAQIDRFDIP